MIRTVSSTPCIATLCAALLVGGCSESDDPDTLPVEPPPGGEEEVPGTLIEGIWESPCLPGDGMSMSGSRDFVLSVTERVFELNVTDYGDNLTATGGCENGLRVFATRGSLEEGLIEDGRVPEDGIPLDLMITQFTLEPLQVPVADDFNSRALCGATDWVPQVDRDVSGCDEISDSDAPRTDYNRYFVDNRGSIDDRSDDTLVLGTLSAQSDPERRPEGLDTSIVFTRRAGSL